MPRPTPGPHSRGMNTTHHTSRSTRHLPHHKAAIVALTRAGSAGAITAVAALTMALPASAQTPPEPQPGVAPAGTVVLSTPVPLPDSGLQVIQIGAGLLAGIGLGAAGVTARRNRRSVHVPHVA